LPWGAADEFVPADKTGLTGVPVDNDNREYPEVWPKVAEHLAYVSDMPESEKRLLARWIDIGAPKLNVHDDMIRPVITVTPVLNNDRIETLFIGLWDDSKLDYDNFDVGPNRTEDLDLFTTALKTYGTPGFEHNYGLWYDRRRDAHDTACRSSANVESPFLELPWGRSDDNSVGTACGGLPKYDLSTFNPFYFQRLKEFSALAEEKGVMLFNNHYMQHNLLELQTHYADFPWRPNNNINNTGLPDNIPAANDFFSVSSQTRNDLHRLYIRKQLDELKDYSSVVHLPSLTYTGSLPFIEFWLDTIVEWSQETDNDPHIGIGATKDVLDAILQDPVRSEKIKTIDLRYWWYKRNGFLYAPQGGQEVAGRYTLLNGSRDEASPESFYQQIAEYRGLYPDKAILHFMGASRDQTWAFLMAGGSSLVRYYNY